MKVLIIIEDIYILKGTSSGASSLIQSRLELLLAAGCAIDVLIFTSSKSQRHQFSIDFSKYSLKPTILNLSTGNQAKPTGIRSLTSVFQPVANRQEIDQITTSIRQSKPDILWAEHFKAAWIGYHTKSGIPLIYSHHDWTWLIHQLKNRGKMGWKQRLKLQLRRASEERLVRKVNACVTGSLSDEQKMKKMGAKKVDFFPTTYEPVDLDCSQVDLKKPRIVHLGSMNTTANRLGLERFLEVVWPDVCQRIGFTPELWIIGDIENASPYIKTTLQKAGAICTGYVDDLTAVLRPYDIHIIPWEYDTGTRTRVPLILNYAQILISTRAAVECYGNILQSGKNCVLADKLTDLTPLITGTYTNPASRQIIGNQARKTFEQYFVKESLIERFSTFIESLL